MMKTNDPHRLAWDSIPWVLNGSADDASREQLLAHLQECADCRAEYEFQQHLQQGMGLAGAAPGLDAERALQVFWSARPQQPQQPQRPRAARSSRWLVAAVIVQTLGLAGLGGVIGMRWSADEYRVLSEPQPVTTAVLRVVPAPGLQIGELRALLARSDLQLVQASADAGHLGLALSPGARFSAEQALRRLRAEPGILLAEPIASQGN